MATGTETDLIIGGSLLMAEAVVAELRARLAERLARSWKRGVPDWQLLELAREVLGEFEPILAELIADADLSAWIAGFDKVAKRLPESVIEELARGAGFDEPPPPPFAPPGVGDGEPIIRFPVIEEARDDLIERKVLTRDKFDRLTEVEKRRAFTIAGEQSEATLEKVRDVLADNVDRGASLSDFQKTIAEEIDTSRIGPGHLENVFRTNVQQSFNDGHESIAQDPFVSEVFPYQAYNAIDDGRVRKTHIALEKLGIDGTNIYRRDDPFWDVFSPPWDFQCRCGVTLMTIEAAAKAGVREAQEWLDTGVKPPVVSRLADIPFRPRAGFSRRGAVAV